MKRLYKKLAVTFVLSSVLIAMLFTVSLYKRSREENVAYLHQLLESTNVNLNVSVRDREEKMEILEKDYLNRAWAVEYILYNDFDSLNGGTGLSVINDLMEVKGISVIGSSGKVLMSTSGSTEITGENYSSMEELENLLSLSGEKACLVSRGDYSHGDGLSYFYVLVKSKSDRFAAVRLDADVSKLGIMSDFQLIKSTLKQATTEYDTSIFAVDKTSGDILGITENNTQRLIIDSVTSNDELLEFLNLGKEKKSFLARIDGKIAQTVVESLDEVYFVAFTDMEKVFGNVARTFVEGFLGIGGISLLTILLVHYHITGMEKELFMAKTEAKYDKLTGLYNRNGFEKSMEEFLSQEDIRGVLLLLDLDNFKKINDSEGHPEGDRILEKFSECLRSVFRREDSIGRLGGDEFVVLIQNNMPEKILRDKLEKVLQEVRNMLGNYRDKYNASVSIGAVPVDGSVKTFEALYKYADAALYIAKYMGKNQYYINDRKITCAKDECSFYAKQEECSACIRQEDPITVKKRKEEHQKTETGKQAEDKSLNGEE